MFKKVLFIISIVLIILLSITSLSAEENSTNAIATQQEISTQASDSHTFTDLQKEIKNADAKSTLYLSGTYKYDKKSDTSLTEGVTINKDIKIVGKNSCTIDGSGLARCLKIKKGCTVTLQNIKVKNGYTTSSGAGIKIYANAKVTIKNCVFDGNVAKNSNGGAIESKEQVTLKISSSTFKNNKATRTSSLPWEQDKKGMGGAIKTAIGTTLKISDSTFKSNSAYLATILVVSQSDSGKKTSNLNVNKCIFSKNKSQHNGVIYSDEYGTCTIKNSVFKYNLSPDGAGTLVIESASSAIIKNCVFYKNKGCNGAAINVKIFKSKDTCKVKITNCKFTKNTASMYGGAICSVGGKVSVKNCQFTSNTASIFGGAVYARLGTLDVSSSKFSKNKANYAGALCMACKKATTKSSSFTKNKAYYLYGAVYNTDHNNLKKCSFTANKVLKYSKIYMSKSGNKISVKVTDNTDKPVQKKVKLIFKGSKKVTTKWYKTSSKKSIKIKIPKSLKGDYTVTMKVKKANYFKKTLTIKV